MRITKISTILIILLTSSVCFGQEYIHSEDENWLRDFNGEYSQNYVTITYRLDNYTKEDIPKAKQKLVEIKKSSSTNEWEGVYYQNIAIGDDMMIWNAESGFFSFYYYHELRSLDFGITENKTDSIKLISEKPVIAKSGKKQNYETEKELIKVKIGDSHYLVPANCLQEFIHITAGLNNESDDFYRLLDKK